jgi:hypothetical protein
VYGGKPGFLQHQINPKHILAEIKATATFNKKRLLLGQQKEVNLKNKIL